MDQWGHLHPGDKAVDGNKNFVWGPDNCFATAQAAKNWFEVDLEKEFDVAAVVIYNRHFDRKINQVLL